MNIQRNEAGAPEGVPPLCRMKFHPNYFLSICNLDGHHLSKVKRSSRVRMEFSNLRGTGAEIKIMEPLSLNIGTKLVALIKQNPVGVTPILEFYRYDNEPRTITTEIFYHEPILSCTSSKNYLAVCSERSIFVYRTNVPGTRMASGRRAFTSRNTHGVCAISEVVVVVPCYLDIFPRGAIAVLSTITLNHVTTLHAHYHNPVVALAFSASGTSLATASKNHIRVFSVSSELNSDWPRLYQFNINIGEMIPTLNFSRCSEYLTCCGTSPTIHIFRLTDDNKLANIAARAYNVHQPPVKYDYSANLEEVYPVEKVVTVRYIENHLYLYVFKEYGMFTAYLYDNALQSYVQVYTRRILRISSEPRE